MIMLLVWLMIFEIIQSLNTDVFELSIINYGHLTSTQESIRIKEEHKMLYAMEQIGFMIITNHGISKHIMDDVWNQTREFFDSSLENKQSVPLTKDYIYGYSAEEIASKSEQVEYFKNANAHKSGTIVNDLKETFSVWIGAENTNRLNDVSWPPYPLRMKESWIAYYRECETIAAQLLRSFAHVLGLTDDYFELYIDDHMSALRALNYPQEDLENRAPEGAMRCSAHSDFGTFTLLRQDDVGGLQLEYEYSDGKRQWVDIVSDHYDFIVNLGNTMKIWTNDRFKATRHRVMNPRNEYETQRRQSIAFFHNLNGNAMIETFPSCTYKNGSSKYKAITFVDLLNDLFHGAQTGYYVNNHQKYEL